MPIKRINEFPEGSGTLTNDDVFLFMDDPSNSGTTKKISLSQLAATIGGGGGGDTFDAAVEWTANHTLADGTRYLANDLVYVSGRLYKANFDNESLPVTNTQYWTDVGAGYRLNIDGRDIPNIPHPTITNSGDNRILTSTGSSSGINAEANMTFNGSSLIVSGNAKFTQIHPTVSDMGGVTGSVASDVSTGQIFNMTLNGPITLSNPTNSIDGVTVRWRILQDGTGGHTVSLDTAFVIPSSASNPLPWSVSPNAMDILAATYHAGRDKWDIVAFVPGY